MMKKTFTHTALFLALACIASLTGCGIADPIEPLGTPSLSVTTGYTAVNGKYFFEKGEKVRLNVIGTVPGGTYVYQITKKVDTGAPVIVTPTQAVQVGTVDINYTPEIEVGKTSATATINEPVGSTVTLSVETRNAQGTKLTTATFQYTVAAQGQGGGGMFRNLYPLITGIDLVSQTTASGRSYFASMVAGTNGIYSTADINFPTFSAKKFIDITVGTGDATGMAQTGTAATHNIIISPKERANKGFDNPMGADASETTFKATTLTSLASVTTTDVANIDHSTGAVKFIAFGNTITASASIYSFVNAQGAKGYLRIVSVTPASTGSDQRTVRLEVLVQK